MTLDTETKYRITCIYCANMELLNVYRINVKSTYDTVPYKLKYKVYVF